MNPPVSIVIPSWNGQALLEEFLPSVVAAAGKYSSDTGAETEIIIVDDGSTDSTVSWLREHQKKVSVISNGTNLGFGASCNRGFAAAKHRLVLLLNNDVDVAPDIILPLTENFDDPFVFAAHSRVFELENGRECGVGKLGSFSRGFIRVHRSYMPCEGAGSSKGHLISMFAGGGSSMFDRDKFLEMGGFDLLLAPFYWEDVELSYRAWKRGYLVVYEPRAVAHHRISATIGRLGRGHVSRIQRRNRLIYHWVHLHDKGLMLRHIGWIVLLVLSAPFRLEMGFLLSFSAAMGKLPTVLRRRAQEKLVAKRGDRQIFAMFEAMEQNRLVVGYDNDKELEALRSMPAAGE